MRRTLDGVDGVEGIGADQNNITRLTIKIFIVDMELSSPFIDRLEHKMDSQISYFTGTPILRKDVWRYKVFVFMPTS